MKRVLVVAFQSLTRHSVGGAGRLAWHIAQQLNAANELDHLVVSAKGAFDTPFPSAAVSLFSRYYLYLLNLLVRKGWLREYKKRFAEEWLFDFFCRFQIKKGQTHLITTTPYLKRSFRKARRMGITIVYVPGNPDENAIEARMLAEQEKWGLRLEDVYTYQRRIRFYNEAIRQVSTIACLNELVLETFQRYAGGPTVKLVPGYIWEPGSVPTTEPRHAAHRPVRFGYIGHTVLLKGVHNLLRAWQGIEAKDATLTIAGSIDPSIRQLINQQGLGEGVQFPGRVPHIGDFYRNIDVMIVPSLIDACPSTVMEALAYGVPVIASDQCGNADLIQQGSNGYVFRYDDAMVLHDCMQAVIDHPETLRAAPLPQKVDVALLARNVINTLESR